MSGQRHIQAHGAIAEGSAHVLQDAWGSSGSVAWVIDGVTRRTDEHNVRVAEWVGELSAALAVAESALGEAPLMSILEGAILEAAGPVGDWHPSATVAMVRMRADGAEYLVLADAGVLVPSGAVAAAQRWVRVQDRRPAECGARVVAQTPGAGFLTRWIETEKLRNAKGGFWVAGALPEAASEALTGFVPGAREALLMSDGVFDEIDTELKGPRAAWDALTTDGERTIAELRHRVLERDGRADDMTSVWVKPRNN